MSDELELAGDLAARFEGLYLHRYLCPAGVWTIGYGATRDLHGVKVSSQTPDIVTATAKVLLRRDLDSALVALVRLTKGVVLTKQQRAAVVDFIFNLGSGSFKASALRARILRHDPRAYEELDRWVFGGGRKLAGLVARRAAERALWLTSPPSPAPRE